MVLLTELDVEDLDVLPFLEKSSSTRLLYSLLNILSFLSRISERVCKDIERLVL